MTEQQQLNTITTNATFIKTAGVLASKLHIEVQDARQLLLTEIWEHRYHGLQDIATTGLTNKQTRDIVFSRKDIERKQFNQDNAEMKLFVSSDNNQEQVNNIATQSTITTSYSEQEVQRVLVLVPTIFRQANHDFVTMLLTQGEDNTRQLLHLTKKQFNNNLKQLERTLSANHEGRKKADKYLKSDARIKDEANKKQAINLLELLENDTPQPWVQKALQDTFDNEYFDRCWDVVRYQPRMITAYNQTHEAKQDAYRFINELHKLINK